MDPLNIVTLHSLITFCRPCCFFLHPTRQLRLRCCLKCTKHKVIHKWFIFLRDLFSEKSKYKCSLHNYETMVQGCIAELTTRLMELSSIGGLLRSTGARHLFRLQCCCSVLHCHPLLHLSQQGSCAKSDTVIINLKNWNFSPLFLLRGSHAITEK